MHRGESAAISLACELKTMVLLDDSAARSIARNVFSLEVRGTLFVLLFAYRKGIIKKQEIKELLHQLVQEGFRVAPELYSSVLREIERAPAMP